MTKTDASALNELSRLEGQAIVVEDFDEGGDALQALKKLDKTRAQAVALRILREQIGDVYYQAGAFDVLYGVSAPDAVRYMEEAASIVDPYILSAMLTEIAVDSGYIEHQALVAKAVPILRRALACRSMEELGAIEASIKHFDETYPA
ncbi:hypothetical protein INH39_30005 [Massilia violaceinigra]|uniref:Uncharacterized protein n=1 Tax=Massilia violaceinigra TaxID=2045208 RepID=A0ABY4A472_9BURK|nr:hypothetical protein [Massilia violaceinigra]UOD29575.1 hypothetical protein INH39_30005 [Massilia violaceinigra]